MATPEVIAVLAGVSTRTVYRLLEAKRLHFIEGRDGTLLVCLASLPDALNV
jgi:hypothetical protein